MEVRDLNNMSLWEVSNVLAEIGFSKPKNPDELLAYVSEISSDMTGKARAAIEGLSVDQYMAVVPSSIESVKNFKAKPELLENISVDNQKYKLDLNFSSYQGGRFFSLKREIDALNNRKDDFELIRFLSELSAMKRIMGHVYLRKTLFGVKKYALEFEVFNRLENIPLKNALGVIQKIKELNYQELTIEKDPLLFGKELSRIVDK